MGFVAGNTTFSTAGNKVINLGTPSTPTSVALIVQNKLATNEGTLKHVSYGLTDGSTHSCIPYIKNGTNPSFSTELTGGTLVKVYEEIGGVNVVVLEVAFVSLSGSILTCNVITANSNYPAYLISKY